MYDENRPEPSTEPDTENATRFYGADSAGGYRLDGTETIEEHYRRLANLNMGIWTGTWADNDALRRADNLAVFDAIAGFLELSPYQKTVARETFGDLNLRELSSPGGIDATLVAVMVAAAVCRDDGRLYHPNRDDRVNDPLFVSLIDDLGYRDSVVHSCYAKVLERVNL
ncbi:hypothetical protein HRTV-25_gp72 [Halorubrum tailed virus 25]|uniref:Uncharacterized protein n=1 Tax=Halorubrum tailed virus 25 TaxID=2878006 RepID=A0AAE9BYW5_9CAUD|nr:hypothetical protein M1M37_gp072 [Halorubrum tailed virus 25]UBF22653.1 hypothetical protein HRTV-25_gp72 [Halorubrum tailed virus 25]